MNVQAAREIVETAVPSSEAFDAMNDDAFDAFWAARIEAARVVEDENPHAFMQACVDRDEASDARWGAGNH